MMSNQGFGHTMVDPDNIICPGKTMDTSDNLILSDISMV